MSDDLDALRAQIDELDRRIQDAISERAKIARSVAAAKDGDAFYYRPEREAEVLRAVVERNDGPLSNEEMVRLFREIMSSCLAQQEPLKIAYLGPEGTFTQTAVTRHFGHATKHLAVGTIDEVFREVEVGRADFGVVPVENSTEGTVGNTLDMFVRSPVKIAGEVELAIHQNLMGVAEGLEAIERVYAHRQSLAQCRGWLRDHLREAELIAVDSNAEAARRVRHAPDAAAIAGRSAADIYGLNILAAEIQDRDDNTTRFLVLGRRLLAASGSDKTSILMAADNRPGLLYRLLQPLAERGIMLNRIESRPARSGKWGYVFFVDVDGHAEDEPLAGALAELAERTSLFKVLGSYPTAVV